MKCAYSSKKANGAWTFYGSLGELGFTKGNETILEIVRAMPDRSVLTELINTENNASEYPIRTGTLQIARRGAYRIVMTFTSAPNSTTQWDGYADVDGFYGWVKSATATPPQELDLPLAAGVVAVVKCAYSISQDGLVLVGGRVAGRGGAAIPAGLVTLSTLPVGYQPKAGTQAHFSASVFFGGACPGWVASDGRIWVLSPGIAASADPNPANWGGFGFTAQFWAR